MIHNELKTRVVGVNVNVHDTTCAVVDVRGNILGQCSFVTSDYPLIGDYVAVLTEHIMQLAEANGGYEHIRSVGISILSGNFKTGCIENSPSLPWKGVIPLAAMLRDQLGLAVALANNAHVIALGEQAFGAAHGMRDFVVISLGSGLGSCIYCNGVPHLGANGFAGDGSIYGCLGCCADRQGADGRIVRTQLDETSRAVDASHYHRVVRAGRRLGHRNLPSCRLYSGNGLGQLCLGSQSRSIRLYRQGSEGWPLVAGACQRIVREACVP